MMKYLAGRTGAGAVIRTLAPLIVAVAAATFIACSGEEVEEALPPDTEQGAVFTEDEARAAAEAMLLELVDLPPGWTEQPADDDDSPPPPELTGECAGLLKEDGEELGMVVEVESREFASPDEAVEVQFSAEVFEDEAAAAQSFVDMRRLAGDCRDQFEEAFVEAVRTELESRQPAEDEALMELEVTAFELSEVPFSGFGDESAALRLSTFFLVAGRDFVTYIDLVGVRVGNVSGGFSFQTANDTPETAAEESFAAQVEQRAQQAVASLRGDGTGSGGAGEDTPFTEGEARTAAEDAVLTSEDFPAGEGLPGGWTSVPHDSEFTEGILSALSGAGLPEFSEGCQLFLDIHLASTDRGVAEVWSDGFLGRDIGTVDSSVAVFANESEARESIQQVRALVDGCSGEIKEFWTRLSEVAQGGLVTVTKYEFGELSLASFGDESFALRMAMVAVGPDEDDLTKDIAVVRAGNVVGLLQYQSAFGEPQPDRALEERLMGIIEQRRYRGRRVSELASWYDARVPVVPPPCRHDRPSGAIIAPTMITIAPARLEGPAS